MSEPRRHHLVPAFYLRGFSNNGRLHVFDYNTGKRYRTTAENACRETDFFRLEYPGEDAQFIEKLMAEHEGKIARFTQSIARDRRASRKGQIGEVLSLAALIAARSRRGRRQLETVLAGKVAKALRDGTVTEPEWERHRAVELANGASEVEVPHFQQAKEGLVSGTWFPKPPRALVVGLIPLAQDALLKMLQWRHWELHVTDADQNGGFITSDSPLVWGNLDEIVDGRDPSLHVPGLEITFPVSRDAALVSTPHARDGNVATTDEVVGHINMRTLQCSMGVVIHGDNESLLVPRDGRVRTSEEYFTYQADARGRGIIRP